LSGNGPFGYVVPNLPHLFKPTSTETNEIMKAMLEAQKDYTTVNKNRTADVGKYKYRYADLADVMESVRAGNQKYGLTVNHFCYEQGDALYQETRVNHVSGQWMACQLPLHAGSTPQALGGEITYMRRYATCMLLGVVADEDVDAQPAEDEAKGARSARKKGARKRAASKPEDAPKGDAPGNEGDGETPTPAAQSAVLRAWFGQARNLMKDIVPETAAQEVVIREIMGTMGVEHTSELTAQQRSSVLMEIKARYDQESRHEEGVV
jgi:hypothetical protein